MSHIGRGVILVVVIGLWLWLPALFFDDAYITFRYAEHIARGDGFTWNPPDRVLGATTPLFTLLLAGAARLGFDLESAALILGLAGHLLLCLAAFDLVPRTLETWPDPPGLMKRLLVPSALAVHAHLAFTAVGGMETSLYCALILATILAAARGGELSAGALLGLAFLTRPDALILAPIALWLIWRMTDGAHTIPVFRFTGMALFFAAPWVIFATLYFGSPVPASIAAKRVVHPEGVARILGDFATFLRDDPFLIVAVALAIGGAWWQRKRPVVVALAAFVLAYLAACAFGGVEPFPWYVNPIIPPVFLLAGAGLSGLATRIGLDRAPVWAILTIGVIAVGGFTLARQAPDLMDAWDMWEGEYEVVASWIMDNSEPGDRIYVGEVGVIGYLLDRRVVIDSSGINSPEVLAIRRGRAEGDPEWSRQVIRDLKPDFITTSWSYLNIRTIAAEPWFRLIYEEVYAPLIGEDQVIYRRRPGR